MTSCAATTTIRERLESLALVLAVDDPVSNRHVVDALGALASLEQLVEAAQEVVGHSDAAFVRLAAALAAVGPGEADKT